MEKMNKEPKVSVIVPVYKAEAYLHRCVDSIIAQTFTDWELLLVDDGSPDRSGEICDEYASKDKRIRVFHKENGGVSSARQRAWMKHEVNIPFMPTPMIGLNQRCLKNSTRKQRMMMLIW